MLVCVYRIRCDMMRLFITGISVVMLGFPYALSAQNTAVDWRGQKLHLTGCNVAWLGYGADFGRVEEWGDYCAYSHSDTETMFSSLADAGGNCVRWWVFCDGRGAPEFDSNNGGNVTGLDSSVMSNMDDVINLAEDYGIYIIFCLWDFGMLFDDSTAGGRGEHAGGHRNLVVDDAARGTFITNALLPMLRHRITNSSYTVATHPNVLAWEIINEPEWGITESGAVDEMISNPVSLVQMQEFVAKLSGVIHRQANQLVTLGSACLKWNSDTALGAAGNWWKDSALIPYDADGALDFYQFHYYGWMNGDYTTWSYSPLSNSAADASFDKPAVIGEFPANGGSTTWTVAEIINGCYSNGYAGCWAWTYQGVDTCGSWTNCRSAYAAFGSNRWEEIRPPADLDSDHDGMPNTAEFIAGTDVDNHTNHLAVSIRYTQDDIEVSFEVAAADGAGYGGVDRYYALCNTVCLATGAWQAVAGYDRMEGTNGRARCRIPMATDRFYRACVWLENR